MKCGKTNARLIVVIIFILLIVVIIKGIKVNENFKKFNDDIEVENKINQYNILSRKLANQEAQSLVEQEKKQKLEETNSIINKLTQKIKLMQQLINTKLS